MESNMFIETVDLFVKNLKIDKDIKRVNFIVYRDQNKKDTIFKTMNLDTYLDKTLKQNKLMFNLIDVDYSLCKRDLLNILLTNRDENLTIVVLDVFKDSENLKNLNKMKEIKKISKNLKNVLKTINLVNKQIPVYLMGLNDKTVSKRIVNRIYKEVIKKTKNTYYVVNNNDKDTSVSNYKMLMDLFNKVNDTLSICQTKIMFDKAVKNSINELECENSIDHIIKYQRTNGVSIYNIKESMEDYLENVNEDKSIVTIFKERINAAKRVIEKRVN